MVKATEDRGVPIPALVTWFITILCRFCAYHFIWFRKARRPTPKPRILIARAVFPEVGGAPSASFPVESNQEDVPGHRLNWGIARGQGRSL